MGNTVIEVNKAWSFSTMSVDNINVDIQSSLSTTSLHGTAASINQHPTRNNEGQTGQRICLNKGVSKLKKHSTGILKHHHITYQMIHLSPFAVSRPLQTYWRALFCRKMRLSCKIHLQHLGLCFTHVLNQFHCVKILGIGC